MLLYGVQLYNHAINCLANCISHAFKAFGIVGVMHLSLEEAGNVLHWINYGLFFEKQRLTTNFNLR